MVAKTKKTTKKVSKKTSIKTVRPVKENYAFTETPKTSTPKRKFGFKKLALLALVLGLLYLGRGLFVAALVDGMPISRLSVVKELEKQGGKEVLDGLVTKRLIVNEANKKGIAVSDDEINGEVERIKKLAEAQGLTLENALSYQGQTLDQLKENIRLQKNVEKILADKITVTDDEVAKYFDENKDAYTGKKLEEVKDDIIAQLKNQKLSTEYQTWITDLKANSRVQYVVNY